MRHFRPLVLLALASLFSATGLADPPPALCPAVQEALERAGANRDELLKTLQYTPPEQREGMEFLLVNMPQPDLTALKADFLLENAALAYEVMTKVPWGNKVPKEVFLNDVLPYANINERRDNWRKDFLNRFLPLVRDCKTPGEAGLKLNSKIFGELKVRYSRARTKADQSPYESIETGKASCTGLSILLIDACRAVGVPARFAGIPMWPDRSGNHSWVEIWDEGWHFTGAAEPHNLDQAWFVGRAAGAQRDHPLHAIYAVSYRRTPLRFPLIFDPVADYVSAVNVTDRYASLAKPLEPGKVRLAIGAVTGKDGQRVAAKIKITDVQDRKVVFEGVAKDERFDLNDRLSAVLTAGRAYRIEARFLDRTAVVEVKPDADPPPVVMDLSAAKVTRPAWQTFSAEEQAFADSEQGKRIASLFDQYFNAEPAGRGKIAFDAALDQCLLEHSGAVRKLVWRAYRGGRTAKSFEPEVREHRVAWEKHVSPYVVRAVGSMPQGGWPLFIAMHGGGGAPQEVNDQQWRVMQIYYRDQPSVEGYLYLAPRAPNNHWNGFYDVYNLHLTARLVRQLLAHADVDPNKVYLMGYSHGGYGTFMQGFEMPDLFAAIHASAAAPMGYDAKPRNLRNTPFTFMIGTEDNMYGRLNKCKWLEDCLKKLRGERTDIYPGGMELKESGHTGLPDRDKIREMYPAVRTPVPRRLAWTPGGIREYFNWLYLPGGKGDEIEAACDNNQITIKCGKTAALHLLLDERLIDHRQPVVITANGKKQEQKLSPSLKTLCELLEERGDPELMFATRVVLKFEVPPVKSAPAKE